MSHPIGVAGVRDPFSLGPPILRAEKGGRSLERSRLCLTGGLQLHIHTHTLTHTRIGVCQSFAFRRGAEWSPL